jgi:hypothetical protein
MKAKERFNPKRVATAFMYGESILALVIRYDRSPSEIENAIRKTWRLPRRAKGKK